MAYQWWIVVAIGLIPTFVVYVPTQDQWAPLVGCYLTVSAWWLSKGVEGVPKIIGQIWNVAVKTKGNTHHGALRPLSRVKIISNKSQVFFIGSSSSMCVLYLMPVLSCFHASADEVAGGIIFSGHTYHQFWFCWYLSNLVTVWHETWFKDRGKCTLYNYKITLSYYSLIYFIWVYLL